MPQAQHLEMVYNICSFSYAWLKLMKDIKNISYIYIYCGKRNDILPLEQLKIFSKRENKRLRCIHEEKFKEKVKEERRRVNIIVYLCTTGEARIQ